MLGRLNIQRLPNFWVGDYLIVFSNTQNITREADFFITYDQSHVLLKNLLITAKIYLFIYLKCDRFFLYGHIIFDRCLYDHDLVS